ncbi:Maf family protein [Bounagaea algeriensis]
MRFVLASASPARLSVLRSAGVDPVVRVSGVDEQAVLRRVAEASPGEQVTALASAKAEAVVPAVAEEFGDAVVVGCDSMLHTRDGEVVGKPGAPETAKQRWLRNAGSQATLLTGHAVVRISADRPAARAQAHRATTVRFSTPGESEVDAYIGTGEPLHVAGGFTLDGFGGWFVEGVDGDPSSVLGISLPLTRNLLAEAELSVVTLWNQTDTEQ